MKSREHINQIKEKLIYSFYKRLNDENKDVPDKSNEFNSSEDIDNSIDSTVASNNTPKNVKIGSKKDENDRNEALVLPHANVIYKYFIGKGNNSIMVRSLFKNRYWWV